MPGTNSFVLFEFNRCSSLVWFLPAVSYGIIFSHFFYISVIQSFSTECDPDVWSLLLNVRVVRDDGRHMYLEKFDQNGELISSKRLGYKSPHCSYATFLDEGYIVGSNRFVSLVLSEQESLSFPLEIIASFTTKSVLQVGWKCRQWRRMHLHKPPHITA